VAAVPWNIFPAHLASIISRTGSLAEALMVADQGDAARAYSLGVEAFFQASHAVLLSGRLGPAHAHSWHVRASFTGDDSLHDQVLVDFASARLLLKSAIADFEGAYLNTIPPFHQPECQPTVENFVAVLFDQLDARSGALGLRIEEVTLWENPTSYARCRRTMCAD
jgi:6-pyruvoyl-tetrahydropterin synthase